MNEQQFKEQLISWELNLRDAIIPTSVTAIVYGEKEARRVISAEQEEMFYAYLGKMEISDTDYEYRKQLGKNDAEILYELQVNYDRYLTQIRKKIVELQKAWSNLFAHERASLIIEELGWINVYHICHLVEERIVPIELILKYCFLVPSYYGERRARKAKSEINVDPRILNTPRWTKNKGY